MTQYPYAGPVTGEAPPAGDFGATTVSGTPRAKGEAASGRAPASPSAGAAPDAPRVPQAPKPPPEAQAPRGIRPRGPRRARLQLRHINPWTVLKFSCVLSIALFFVWLIVVGVLYGVLDTAGVIGKINDTITTINGAGSQAPVTAGIVFGGAAIIGVIDIVLFIALSTIGSVVYNLCADLVGGIELTLSER
ncbi:MAG: DUF3566 domain-containing protein [Jatrophihabitantaceae bacterium]